MALSGVFGSFPCQTARSSLSAPFVNEIGYEPGPSGLVAGAQPGSSVTVKILIEEQVITPVRIVLEFAVVAKTGPPARAVPNENINHPICNLFRHLAGTHRLGVAVTRRTDFKRRT